MPRTKTIKNAGDNDLGFKRINPSFSYSLSGNLVTIRIVPVEDAEGYELYRSLTPKEGFSLFRESSSPLIDFYLNEKKSYYYKVLARKGFDEDRVTTQLSDSQYVDVVSAAKMRNEKMDAFLESLMGIRDTLTVEDLDIALETIRVAGRDAREKAERKKLEEEAEKRRIELEKQRKRREAQAKRAEELREKKRLEHIESVTRMDLPLDYVNRFEDDDRIETQCESSGDALIMSLDMLGMVDIEFISQASGNTPEKVISDLRGSIFQNPLHWNEVFYKGWETAAEYLSGNLNHKLKIAKEENEKYNGYFQANVDALECLVEPDLPVEDIYITLGSPWVPTDVIDDFIAYMAFGGNLASQEAKEYYEICSDPTYAVRHNEYTGTWQVPEKNRFQKGYQRDLFREAVFHIYGTERMNMLHILENTLNMKTLTATDLKNPDDENCRDRVLNKDETLKLIEKQKYMIETFQRWVWTDETRKRRLQSHYCNRYGNNKVRVFDGSFLKLPGLNPDIQLYDYQKNAVERIIMSPNTLLAHDVGAGKTYTMIAAGMELRRLGKSKKNLYVIPNGIIAQWERIFKMMYPQAKLLVVTIKNFDSKHKSETLQRIKDEDYDAILMAYSCFDMLSLSDRFYEKLYQERIEMLRKAMDSYTLTGRIANKIDRINKLIENIKSDYQKVRGKEIPFDELGINTLFVDEAHNYKNIDLETKISRVRGVGGSKSKHGTSMMDKVHCVQRMNDGGRVVFATGTPVTNSLSDIFAMQKYLQEGELEFQGITTFDSWAGMYAEKVTDFEIDIDTNSYNLITRFGRFSNIPELTATLSSIIDFHRVDKTSGIPEIEGYSDEMIPGSECFRDYLMEISARADDIRQKRVKISEDNMLKVTTDGRKAALDMRLVDTVFGMDPESKVVRCAEKVFEVYNETRESKSTQLVFCDISTPKQGFNLYDELKKLLVAMGMPANEIAFIHDFATDAERNEMFDSMRKGKLAVLIGSTSKMGHGMNVQNKLIAIHHLDVPWRPSDMVQREGRILRQGNENSKVRIFRYITKASFDAYSWQLLEMKQRFISQIMSGKATMRDGKDIDDAVLNYAEVKALAVGNPKIKRRVEVSNELDKYRILQNEYCEDRHKKKIELQNLPKQIEAQKNVIENCGKDIEAYAQRERKYEDIPDDEQKAIRESIFSALKKYKYSPTKVFVLNYMGFDVFVPPNSYVSEIAPAVGNDDDGKSKKIKGCHILLEKNGIYQIEIEAERGITKRLNNFLDNLGRQKEKFEEELRVSELRKAFLEEELAKEEGGYMDEISRLSDELDELNDELGVA